MSYKSECCGADIREHNLYSECTLCGKLNCGVRADPEPSPSPAPKAGETDMTANVKLAERLEAILCDPDGNVCCYGSDGDRQELQSIIQALRSPSPAQGMYSIEDFEAWKTYWYFGCDVRGQPNIHHPIHGIATWKSKQPPSTNDAPTRTVVTPESLRAMTAWFDDPKNPAVTVTVGVSVVTSGYLLRQIADALAKQLDAGGK